MSDYEEVYLCPCARVPMAVSCIVVFLARIHDAFSGSRNVGLASFSRECIASDRTRSDMDCGMFLPTPVSMSADFDFRRTLVNTSKPTAAVSSKMVISGIGEFQQLYYDMS